jgi:hypothetical protein
MDAPAASSTWSATGTSCHAWRSSGTNSSTELDEDEFLRPMLMTSSSWSATAASSYCTPTAALVDAIHPSPTTAPTPTAVVPP